MKSTALTCANLASLGRERHSYYIALLIHFLPIIFHQLSQHEGRVMEPLIVDFHLNLF